MFGTKRLTPLFHLLILYFVFLPSIPVGAINFPGMDERNDLFSKVIAGDMAALKDYLEKGGNPNLLGPNLDVLLNCAAKAGHFDMVKLLVAKGAKVQKNSPSDQNSPILSAARAGHLEMLKFFEKQGYSIETKSKGGSTALKAACWSGKLDVVKYLVQSGLDVNAPDPENAPLIAAADSGNLEMVKFLVEKGAEVDPRPNISNTPLENAVHRGHLEVAKYLISKGADPTRRDRGGYNLVHTAANSADVEILRYVLTLGLDVNAKDFNFHWTPLHIAAYKRKCPDEIAKLLVMAGADPSAKERKDSYTPIDFARHNEKPELAEWLEERSGSKALIIMGALVLIALGGFHHFRSR